MPGSAEVSRGVPRLRGTVSGRLSHTKVFHRGRDHAELLTIANGRRRSKAVTEPAAVSETTVGGGMGSTTRENWANPLAVPSTADPGRPLSPLLSFVSHIFDSASDRLCRRLSSVRRLHDVDFETACELPLHPPHGLGSCMDLPELLSSPSMWSPGFPAIRVTLERPLQAALIVRNSSRRG